MGDAPAGPVASQSALDGVVLGAEPEQSIARLRSARDQLLRCHELAPGLRPVIQRSWPRCLQFAVSPDTRRLDTLVAPQLEARVQRAVTPVLRRLEDLVRSTRASVILADAEGTVADVRGEPDVRRRLESIYPVPGASLSEAVAGTNAIGTAIEEGGGVQVWSGEHFIEAFQGFLCTAIPIRDPLSRKVLAILDLTVRDRDVSPSVVQLLARLVANAATEVEQALVEQLAAREQALLFSYLRELRRRHAVIAFDGRTTIASKGALGLLEEGDLAALLAYAEETIRTHHRLERPVMLGSGQVVQLSARPQFDGGECIGSILQLKAAADEALRPPAVGLALPPALDPFADLVGQSAGMRQALELARVAVEQALPAYLFGEPGAGKYALAQAMAHATGLPSATVECRAVPPRAQGWLAEARQRLGAGGVLIFRHLDALKPSTQRVLLALLNDEVCQPLPRLIATAQRPAVRSGLAPALLLRFAAIQVKLPPLRERREDIAPLAQTILERSAGPRRPRLSPAALQALAQADWPGNVQQLEQVLRSAMAVARGAEIGLHDLSEQLGSAGRRPRLSRLEEAELEAVRAALRDARGNRSRAAALLGIGRSTLYRKLDVYRLKGLAPLL